MGGVRSVRSFAGAGHSGCSCGAYGAAADPQRARPGRISGQGPALGNLGKLGAACCQWAVGYFLLGFFVGDCQLHRCCS